MVDLESSSVITLGLHPKKSEKYPRLRAILVWLVTGE